MSSPMSSVSWMGPRWVGLGSGQRLGHDGESAPGGGEKQIRLPGTVTRAARGGAREPTDGARSIRRRHIDGTVACLHDSRRVRGYSLASPGHPFITFSSISFTSLSFWYCSSNSLKNAAFLPRTTTEPPRLM